MSNSRHLSQSFLVCFSHEKIQCKNKNLPLSCGYCVARDGTGPSVYMLLNMTPLENFRVSVVKYKSTYQVHGWVAYSSARE